MHVMVMTKTEPQDRVSLKILPQLLNLQKSFLYKSFIVMVRGETGPPTKSTQHVFLVFCKQTR